MGGMARSTGAAPTARTRTLRTATVSADSLAAVTMRALISLSGWCAPGSRGIRRAFGQGVGGVVVLVIVF